MPTKLSVKNGSGIKSRFKDFNFENPHSLFLSAVKGVRPKVFYDFAAAISMPEKALANLLHLSSRTIGNYKEQQKTLAPLYSEHLLKLIALYAKGETMFGSVDEFNYWLQKPFWNASETPISWMITPGGTDLLMEELERLAQGYPV